ncbi:LysR family transcriptional regulator [Luteitalea sp. TBR-22]|uniref:SDR family oxidoreductase n=1 Tax=Luteitalea sp. TBR-22 TaxID=2802971 RepID=UPI001AFA4F00|nr:SDR family oxidoreductase [Luteitalea sp. TBR-22]BCS35691.1 LysR family transcriptional regulator [Luteitalea sp. TBR-22]
MKIVVIGGTGLLGATLVARLAADGHAAVAASRRTGVDALTGRGLAAALEGAAAVVDVSNASRFDAAGVMEHFTVATRMLLEHAAAARVGHVVALSVVGVDAVEDSPYLRAKWAQEALITASGLPHSIVRSTQFFEFLPRLADHALVRSEVRLPPVPVRPIAGEDVARTIASVAVGRPVDGVIELAGPEVFRLDEIVGRVLRARQDARRVVADPRAAYFGARLTGRELLSGDAARIGSTRFDTWLRHSVEAP